MKDMKATDMMLRRIIAYLPDDWEVFLDFLSENEIDEIVDKCCAAAQHESEMYKSIGLEGSCTEEEVCERCIINLHKEASRKMWSQISKATANDMLKVMQDTKAKSITLADGSVYTPQDIITTWKYFHGED